MNIQDLGNNYFQINDEKIYAPNASTAISRYFEKFDNKNNKIEEPTQQIKLRDFQQKAVEDCLGNFMFGSSDDIILYSLPASGKTVMAAALAIEAVQELNYKVVIAVNIGELIDQFYDTITKDFGYSDVSIVKAGYEYKGVSTITIVMQQTLYSRLRDIDLKADLYIQDEWHLCGRGTHRTDEIIRKINPDHVIGMTGTPYTNMGLKIKGDYVSTYNYEEMIENKYLDYLNMIYCPIKVNVGVSGNDYNQKEMGEAYSEECKMNEVIKKWLSIKSFDPKKVKAIWFLPDIKTCRIYTKALQQHGLMAFEYTSDSNKDTNIIMDAFKNNKRIPDGSINLFNFKEKHKHITPRICVSVNKVSIGFNCPDVECVALVGTTKIRSMYEQRSMRAGRKSSNKNKSYLVDFGENIKLHGHPQQIYVPIESDNFKEIKEEKEKYSMNFIDDYIIYQDNENIAQEAYKKWIDDILNSSKSYSEMSVEELQLNFKIDNRIENLTTIAFAFMYLVHGEPMTDKWNNKSTGYMSEKFDRETNKKVFVPVVGFYNEKTVVKCINSWTKVIDEFPEDKKRTIKSFKTIARRYVNDKKNIFGLTYQANWLRDKYIEERTIDENEKKIQEEALNKANNNKMNESITSEIQIDNDIPF